MDENGLTVEGKELLWLVSGHACTESSSGKYCINIHDLCSIRQREFLVVSSQLQRELAMRAATTMVVC